MRGIAIISVVVIHSFGKLDTNPGPGLNVSWLLTYTRPCIALFLFASGYFFRMNASGAYLGSRLKRIIIPYLFFSLLALIYQTRLVHLPDLVISKPLVVIGNMIIGNTWGAYWFIPALLLCYLLGFLFLRGDRSRVLRVTLIFLVINLLHAAYYDAVIAHYNLQGNPLVWLYSYRFFPTWPFYFFLGTLFREYNLRIYLEGHRRVVLGVWLGVFLVYNLLFFARIVPEGGYNSIIDTLASVTAIAGLLVLPLQPPVLAVLGQYSYPIYLSHYFFVSFGWYVAVTFLGVQPLWQAVMVLAFALVGPLVLIVLSQKFLGSRTKTLLAV
jgi:peptidoglycan/LPS O-acetylase OafA/YrhL